MCGAYDAFTNMFTYRWMDLEGVLQSHVVSATCHVSSPPLIAYAFGGLISIEAELQDMQGVDDDNIPKDDNFGFHSSPLQLAATQLSQLSQACQPGDGKFAK